MLFRKKKKENLEIFLPTINLACSFFLCSPAYWDYQSLLFPKSRLKSRPRLAVFILITSKFHNYSATFTVKVKSEWGKTGKTRTRDRLWSLFFLCVITDWLTVVVVTFVHSFHFKTDYYDRHYHHYHYYFISDWLCVRRSQGLLWFAGTFCTCEQIWVWECVCACMCVRARNPFALYFLTTSTSHFFIHFCSDREGFFLLVRKNPAS